jgi:hypothetical protein
VEVGHCLFIAVENAIGDGLYMGFPYGKESSFSDKLSDTPPQMAVWKVMDKGWRCSGGEFFLRGACGQAAQHQLFIGLGEEHGVVV